MADGILLPWFWFVCNRTFPPLPAPEETNGTRVDRTLLSERGLTPWSGGLLLKRGCWPTHTPKIQRCDGFEVGSWMNSLDNIRVSPAARQEEVNRRQKKQTRFHSICHSKSLLMTGLVYAPVSVPFCVQLWCSDHIIELLVGYLNEKALENFIKTYYNKIILYFCVYIWLQLLYTRKLWSNTFPRGQKDFKTASVPSPRPLFDSLDLCWIICFANRKR